MAKHRATLRDARGGLRDHRDLLPVLKKLSLFSLTPRQVARILFPDSGDGPHALAGRSCSPADLAANPYLQFHTVAVESGEMEFSWVDDAGQAGAARVSITVVG